MLANLEGRMELGQRGKSKWERKRDKEKAEAEAKRAKRGRPAFAHVARTPSGQISRAKDNPMQSVLAYRMTRYGLTENQAKDQHAATELGRLYLSGQISTSMREAGEKYLACYEDAMRAIKAPIGFRKTNASGDGGDVVTLDYVDWAVGAVARWEVFRVNAACVHSVIIEDQPVGNALPELRLMLTALAKRFGVEVLTA